MAVSKVVCLDERVVIDNTIFKLHYRITSIALLIAGIIVALNEFLGAPIKCMSYGLTVQQLDEMAAYCRATGTFTLQNPANPGIVHDEKKIKLSYYGMVSLMLFFQAFLFYMPHLMWKNLEKGRMRVLTDGLRGADIPPKELIKEKQSRIAKYFIDSLHMNTTYTRGYFYCEVLNFLNAITNIFVTDYFLGGSFVSYGIDVLRFKLRPESNLNDLVFNTFPTETKCEIKMQDSSGNFLIKDAWCIMPLNKIHATVYFYFWFWLVILVVFSASSVLHKALIFSVPKLRREILKRRFKGGASVDIASLVWNIRIEDFFVLHLMGYNFNTKIYNYVLEEIHSKISQTKYDNIESTITGISLQPISLSN